MEHIRSKEVWEASITKKLNDVEFRVPCLEYQVLINCLHAIYGNFYVTYGDLINLITLNKKADSRRLEEICNKEMYKITLHVLNLIDRLKNHPTIFPYHYSGRERLMAHVYKANP